MVKRTLIVIAVVALMATSAQALGPEPHTGKWAKQTSIKVNFIEEMDIGWPFDFVQVFECHKRKIKLVQVECGDIGKGSGDWPCYKDCEDVKVRSNFEIKLGLEKEKIGSIIDQWSVYFDGDSVVAPSESWKTVTVCVNAWKARLLKTTPGTEIEVGKLYLTVKPNV